MVDARRSGLIWHARQAARKAVVVDENGGSKLGRGLCVDEYGAAGAEQGGGQRR